MTDGKQRDVVTRSGLALALTAASVLAGGASGIAVLNLRPLEVDVRHTREKVKENESAVTSALEIAHANAIEASESRAHRTNGDIHWTGDQKRFETQALISVELKPLVDSVNNLTVAVTRSTEADKAVELQLRNIEKRLDKMEGN